MASMGGVAAGDGGASRGAVLVEAEDEQRRQDGGGGGAVDAKEHLGQGGGARHLVAGDGVVGGGLNYEITASIASPNANNNPKRMCRNAVPRTNRLSAAGSVSFSAVPVDQAQAR